MASIQGFEFLPFELISLILIELTPSELLQLGQVCRWFIEVSRDPQLWADKAWVDFRFPRHLFFQNLISEPWIRYRQIQQYQSNLNVSLLDAMDTGPVDLIRYLGQRGATNLNLCLAKAASRKDLNPPFVTDRFHKTQDLVDVLIELGASDLNWALDVAASIGSLDLVKYLLHRQASPTSYTVYLAAHWGHFDVVKVLVQAGVSDVSQALRGAARAGHIEIIRYFFSLDHIASDLTLRHDLIVQTYNEAVIYHQLPAMNCLIDLTTPPSSPSPS